jgi:hypothetical protein
MAPDGKPVLAMYKIADRLSPGRHCVPKERACSYNDGSNKKAPDAERIGGFE